MGKNDFSSAAAIALAGKCNDGFDCCHTTCRRCAADAMQCDCVCDQPVYAQCCEIDCSEWFEVQLSVKLYPDRELDTHIVFEHANLYNSKTTADYQVNHAHPPLDTKVDCWFDPWWKDDALLLSSPVIAREGNVLFEAELSVAAWMWVLLVIPLCVILVALCTCTFVPILEAMDARYPAHIHKSSKSRKAGGMRGAARGEAAMARGAARGARGAEAGAAAVRQATVNAAGTKYVESVPEQGPPTQGGSKTDGDGSRQGDKGDESMPRSDDADIADWKPWAVLHWPLMEPFREHLRQYRQHQQLSMQLMENRSCSPPKSSMAGQSSEEALWVAVVIQMCLWPGCLLPFGVLLPLAEGTGTHAKGLGIDLTTGEETAVVAVLCVLIALAWAPVVLAWLHWLLAPAQEETSVYALAAVGWIAPVGILAPVLHSLRTSGVAKGATVLVCMSLPLFLVVMLPLVLWYGEHEHEVGLWRDDCWRSSTRRRLEAEELRQDGKRRAREDASQRAAERSRVLEVQVAQLRRLQSGDGYGVSSREQLDGGVPVSLSSKQPPKQQRVQPVISTDGLRGPSITIGTGAVVSSARPLTPHEHPAAGLSWGEARERAHAHLDSMDAQNIAKNIMQRELKSQPQPNVGGHASSGARMGTGGSDMSMGGGSMGGRGNQRQVQHQPHIALGTAPVGGVGGAENNARAAVARAMLAAQQAADRANRASAAPAMNLPPSMQQPTQPPMRSSMEPSMVQPPMQRMQPPGQPIQPMHTSVMSSVSMDMGMADRMMSISSIAPVNDTRNDTFGGLGGVSTRGSQR
jgi:hypothetical protein